MSLNTNKLEHYELETLASIKAITFYGLAVFHNKI